MRIGLVFEYATMNGGENSILAAVDQLRGLGMEFVAVLLQTGPLLKQFQNRGISVELVIPETSRLSDSQLAQSLREMIAQQRLDLLHSNSLMMSRRLGRIAEELPVPVTGHLRDIMNLSSASIEDLNKHSRLIAVSDAVRNHCLQLGIESSRIVTSYNGIDLAQFSTPATSNSIRTRLQLPEASFLIATIGQICLRKGQDAAVTAFANLARKHPDLHLLLVGERHSTKPETIQYDGQLDEIIDAAGVRQQFHRLGFCGNVPGLLGEVDLLLHTARQEPLGRVLLEAAASGVPIVATRVGGTAEILTDQQSAMLVEADNVSEIEAAVEELILTPEKREQLCRAAQQTIRERFDIHERAGELVHIWQDVIKQNVSRNSEL